MDNLIYVREKLIIDKVQLSQSFSSPAAYPSERYVLPNHRTNLKKFCFRHQAVSTSYLYQRSPQHNK